MTERHPKGQTRDSNTRRAKYLESGWRFNLATIANYYLVCCEAVRSAILAAAWFLVEKRNEGLQSLTYLSRKLM